jgi:recombination protein RecA
MSKVSAILTKLAKTYKDVIVDVNEVGLVKRQYLESPQLNFIFGGGFGLGRIYEFSGPESGGKSTLATYIGGEMQKKYTERPVVVYVDFEYSFEKAYANTLGLDTGEDNFILLRPRTGEEGFLLLKDLVEQVPVGLIIWDSVATTASVAQAESAFKSTFGGTAKVFAEGLKMLNPIISKFNASLILINQERANIGVMYGPDFKTTGGHAVKYYASWRGRITRIEDIKEKGLTVGIVSKVRNTKNKIGVPKREAELELKFASGFDSENEYLKFIVDLGLVKQGGAWFSNEEWGFKGQGRDSVLEFLRKNPDLFEATKNTVNALLAGETILDIERDESEDDEDSPMDDEAIAFRE